MMDYRLENIYGAALAVSDNHGFGTDALLLADFAAPKHKDIALDLCSGCGIIPAVWLARGLLERAVALEISPEATRLCTLTTQANNWQDKLVPICADLRDGGWERESFTLVSANPPYFELGSGALNLREAAATARSEKDCTLHELARAAAGALRFGGRFCLCHRPERLTDLLTELRGANLEPKRLRLVSHSLEGKPWLLLIEAKKGGRPGLDITQMIYN